MSLITPITLKGCLSQVIVSPTGFLNPMNFAADSFNIKAEVSVANDFEKSLPSRNCQPTVFPYPWVIPVLGKSTAWLGSLPFHINPPLVDQIAVVGLPASAISDIAPDCNKSFLTAS